MPRKAKFNWTGIIDNGDGTFTVDGKVARKRLLKEYHKQGLQVRSHKESDGTYTLSAIGPTRSRGVSQRKPVRSIGQVRTRYPSARRYPMRGRAPLLTRPRYPFGAGYPHTPSFRQRSPNLTQGLGTRFKGWMQGRQARQQEKQNERQRQKIESENTEAKMAKERKQREQQELEQTITRQRTKARLQEERRELEQRQNIQRHGSERQMREAVTRSDQKASMRNIEKSHPPPYPSTRTSIAAETSRHQLRSPTVQRSSHPALASDISRIRRTSELPMNKEQMDEARRKAATQE